MIIQCKKYISQFDKKKLDKISWLTKDNYYIVLALAFSSRYGFRACIQDDKAEPSFIFIDGFEIITQTRPKSWITTIEQVYESLDEIIMLPESWDYPDFFEDLDDHEPKAVEFFIKEASKIYNEEVWPDWLDIEGK